MGHSAVGGVGCITGWRYTKNSGAVMLGKTMMAINCQLIENGAVDWKRDEHNDDSKIRFNKELGYVNLGLLF